MAETVSLSEDGRRATITGRKRGSLQQKMNPMWWYSGFPTSSSARFWASFYCATLKMAPDGFKDFWRD